MGSTLVPRRHFRKQEKPAPPHQPERTWPWTEHPRTCFQETAPPSILGSYPSPNPCDVLGPCEVQAEHIRDRLGAWHAAKDAAGSPTLVQALLDRGVKRCALQMNESQNTARTRSGTLPCLPKEAHSDTRHGSDKPQRHRAE